jgi:phosphoribosylglycinamide formyltransferase 2
VEVIAVDRYENAPGHQVAHRAHVIAMTDGAALRRLVEQEKPHLIVPEIEAIATDMLVEIESRRTGRGHPYCPCRQADI